MMRKILCAAAVVVFSAAVALAGEVKGEVKAVNDDDSTITVTVDGKETTYHVSRFVTVALPGAKELKDVKPGTKVALTMIDGNIDGKDQPVVNAIKAAK